MRGFDGLRGARSSAILFAQISEFEVTFEWLEGQLEELKGFPYRVWRLTSPNHTTYLVLTNIGRTAAAGATQFVITSLGVDLVVNIGVVGALNKELLATQALIVKETTYFDVDLRLFGHKMGQVPGFDAKFKVDRGLLKELRGLFSELESAKVFTSDAFVTASNPLLNEHSFGAGNVVFDMELAAIGQVCGLNNRPFIALKVVSDWVGNKHNNKEYYMQLPLCNYKVAGLVKRLVDYLAG